MILFIYLLTCLYLICVNALHLKGTWEAKEKYTFLSKFGFQKTQIDEIESSRGYVYGNVQANNLLTQNFVMPFATLVIVDSDYILDLYGNATEPSWKLAAFLKEQRQDGSDWHPSEWDVETYRCQLMFNRINRLAWHRNCEPNGKMDFIRQVPCPNDGKFCTEEDEPSRVIPGFQFTYTIQDLRQPRYWYLSLVACWRNETSCQWETTSSDPNLSTNLIARPFDGREGSVAEKNRHRLNSSNFKFTNDLPKPTSHLSVPIEYDIWLVNGQPDLRDYNKFEHQFSFEEHDIFELYLIIGLLYLALACIVQLKLVRASNPLLIVLSVHLWLSSIGALLVTLNLAVFSVNGIGLPGLGWMGNVVTHWAEALLLLLLVATARVGFGRADAQIPPPPLQLTQKPSYSKSATNPQCSLTSVNNDWVCSTPFISEDVDQPGWAQETTDAKQRLIRKSSTAVKMPVNKEMGLDTTHSLPSRSAWAYLTALGLLFVSVQTLLFIWALFDRDPVIDFSVWNTVPGCLLLAFRFTLALWFLALLRQRQIAIANYQTQLVNIGYNPLFVMSRYPVLGDGIDTVQFAAGFLLWLISQPLVVFVGETSISTMYRKKTIISICYCCDYVAASLYSYLQWKSNLSPSF